ncbi:MAG: prephenate dehydratase [Magnetococcales bacterium]|nr:prephenate dehydratase [Magnetococcales bacterium]MBF0115696.1 prephenate dehydratase [Magnetococcales bacterium]
MADPNRKTITLESLRQAIDQIDDQIHDLLMERANRVREVGEWKEKQGTDTPFYRPEREASIHRRLEARHRGPLPVAALHRIYREIISASLNLERKLTVAYLGPEATFTHQAAVKQFGSAPLAYPVRSIDDVFNEVELKRADFGVTPIENSTEGMIHHTLDRLVDSPLRICSEIYLPVSHHLLSREKELSALRVVYGQPTVIAQCQQWLTEYLPTISLQECASTATALWEARQIAGAAVIAGEATPDSFKWHILAHHIEDRAGIENRFLVVGREIPARSGQDKTSLMFSFPDQPGFLHQVLGIFARQELNLTRIESRPSMKRAWDYLFFIDLEGHQEDLAVAAALAELAAAPGVMVKILGSYPRKVL